MDYEFKTTFWDDFSVAEKFGGKAVEETFDRAFAEWKTDYIYLTELVLVLNWKMWGLAPSRKCSTIVHISQTLGKSECIRLQTS